MKRPLAVAIMVCLLLFTTGVFADGEHQPSPQSKGGSLEPQHVDSHSNVDTQHSGIDYHGETGSSTDAVNGMNKDVQRDLDDVHTEPRQAEELHPTNQTEDHGASEGHHGPVVETPPNYKVLTAFGLINLGFILIGIWNKWFKRRRTPSWQV